ncbi:MAG: A/G-specific adenine glycosylase [Bacteroidota bacterium]
MHPVSRQLIEWYRLHARDLPWRHTRDAYQIWLSEVILQQTRVAQGLSYYHAFIERFPTVNDLAAADEHEVLRLWQGLGYYSRARNLHATAIQVVNEFGGVFPDTYDTLIKLKGIGNYTASAIASFCTNEAVPVLDGNVFRFLSRYFGIWNDIAKNSSREQFRWVALDILPKKKAGLHNQAIMEFGALQCKPSNPDCPGCPLSGGCYARKEGKQDQLPVKAKKSAPVNRYFHYLVLRHKGEYLICKRKEKDIWMHLHEFFLVENTLKPSKYSLAGISKHIDEHLNGVNYTLIRSSGGHKHQLTHQTIHARFTLLELKDRISPLKEDAEWMDADQMSLIAFPRLITRFMESDNLSTFEIS